MNFSYPSLEEPKPPVAPEPQQPVQVNGRTADEAPLQEPAAPEPSTVVVPDTLDGPVPSENKKATPPQNGAAVKSTPQVMSLSDFKTAKTSTTF